MNTTDESDHTRLVLLENQVKDLKSLVEMQVNATQDLVDAWESAKGFLAFLQLMGRVVTALAKISAVVAAAWLAVRGLNGAGR